MGVTKCGPGCTCGKHTRAKCVPGCTCWRHNPSPEMVAKLREMSGNRRGARHSEEHRRRISLALTGKPLSDEHRQKMAAVNADRELLKKKSESRKARRKPPETHRQVHKRLVRDRGSARNHLCVDCAQPANSWSYDWRTWEGVAQETAGKRLTFNVNLDTYEPRCHPCHNRLDRNQRAWDSPRHRQGAKLTEADVVWIRTCGLELDAVAAILGIHKATVSSIRLRKRWRHVA